MAPPEGEEAAAKDVEMEEGKAAEQEAGAAEAEAEPKEKEGDAADDKRKRIAAQDCQVNTADATLNVLPTNGGKLLMSLTDSGFQYLLAGARTTVGVKAGRYLFEVKVIEALNPVASGGYGRQGAQNPEQVVRVGVSTAGSSLFLGTEGKESVCFDTEGYFAHDKDWKKVMKRVASGSTLGVLLNLDAASPNANTISLFVNGSRATEPQALPEQLVGQVLFPTITYRNVTLQTNFVGPLSPLPFKCRGLGEAAAADVEKAARLPKPAGEKVEVFFPVGLPEAGFFDYVDQYMAKHPDCIELSDRMLARWAATSGYGKQGQVGTYGTNDRPELRTGIQALDDLSVRRVLRAIAPTVRRNFVVAELKANLIAIERRQSLLSFSSAVFKKTALVAIGTPAAEYRERVHAELLAEKTTKVLEERRRAAEKAERAKAAEEKKKEAEAARKAKEAAEKPAEEGEGGEEKAAEEKPAEAEETKEAVEEKKEEGADADAPITLSEEEKSVVHRKPPLPDISDRILAKAYADFSLPSKDEGFDDVSFVWQGQAECASIVKSWVLERKLTQKVDDLQPGEWFKAEWAKWQSSVQEWRKVQTDFKNPAQRKARLEKKKEEAKAAAAKAGEGEEGGDKEKPDEDEAAADMEVDISSIDLADVKDVTDVGNGEPLFSSFVYEDWALLSIRYEFHLLLHAFKQDLNDADRPSFPESHLSFYYNKYFRKAFNSTTFGVESFPAFVEKFIQDTVAIDEANGFLKPLLPADRQQSDFVKMTEEQRRERQMLVDAGDETAKIKFTRPAPPPPPGRGGHDDKGGKGGHRGGGGGGGGGGGYKRQYQGGPSSYQGKDSKQQRQTYGGYGNYGGYSR